MKTNPETGSLAPFDFDQIELEVPELRKFGVRIETITFDPVIDSSNVSPEQWNRLALVIRDHYEQFDGFVVLHGTDTMVRTAKLLESRLPVGDRHVFVFTGAMIPYALEESDAVFNLGCAITSVQLLTPGVYITMGGRIYKADAVRKNKEKGIFEAIE